MFMYRQTSSRLEAKSVTTTILFIFPTTIITVLKVFSHALYSLSDSIRVAISYNIEVNVTLSCLNEFFQYFSLYGTEINNL